MRIKKLVSLSLCLVLAMSLSMNVSAAEIGNAEILDTNGQVITSALGSVVDTGESSDGYTGEKIMPYGGGDYYYYSDPSPVATSDGGKLYSHAERQRYGDLSGTVRTFRYYIYSKYEGSKTVEKVSSEWYTTAKLRSSATMSLSTTLGSTVSVTAGTQL